MTYMIMWTINAEVRNTQLHSGPGRGHVFQPILEGLKSTNTQNQPMFQKVTFSKMLLNIIECIFGIFYQIP